MSQPLAKRYGAHFPVTARSLRVLGYDYWKTMPVLESGHFDNLVFDDGKYRVWVSRSPRGDFESQRQYLKERLVIETLRNGRWER